MLSNAYLLAKFCFDTAENERNFAEILPKIGNYPTGPLPYGASGPHPSVARLCENMDDGSMHDDDNCWSGFLVGLSFFTNFGKFCKFFANFWRARSRQYQNGIFQQNMRLTAFFKLYKICILLHRCNLKILAKKSVWKISNFRENSARNLQMSQNLENFKFCQISRISAW